MNPRVPATVITGFLGAGKTTLLRHVLTQAGGRRLAVIVNEFGAEGIDVALVQDCCAPGAIIELANGCLCCTVADDFIPAMQALLDHRPDHILIETSGLALPKPLLKAFGWPALRARTTVDGVIAVLDTPAIAAGRFADDTAAVAAQRAADAALDHDNPLAEVFRDQLQAADMVLLNKADLVDAPTLARVRAEVAQQLPRAVGLVETRGGRIDPALLLGLHAAAENDLASRPSLHDEAPPHDHDDFASCMVDIAEVATLDELLQRLRDAAALHGLLRIKGFARVRGKPMRAVVQAVGPRAEAYYDRTPAGAAGGRLVAIGAHDIDPAAVAASLRG